MLFFFPYFDVCLFFRVPGIQIPKACFLEVFVLGHRIVWGRGVSELVGRWEVYIRGLVPPPGGGFFDLVEVVD